MSFAKYRDKKLRKVKRAYVIAQKIPLNNKDRPDKKRGDNHVKK